MVLSFFARNSKINLIALQPKTLKNWQQWIVKHIKPEFALTPSPSLNQFWNKINVKNELIPLLTDLSIFKPLNEKITKMTLREKYDVPIDAFIITHMGHLNEGRNLKSLIPLQKSGYQVLVVGSSSTPKDSF